jgi:hypothetical protein
LSYEIGQRQIGNETNFVEYVICTNPTGRAEQKNKGDEREAYVSIVKTPKDVVKAVNGA